MREYIKNKKSKEVKGDTEIDETYRFRDINDEIKTFGEHLSEIEDKNEIFKYDEDIQHFNDNYLNNQNNNAIIRAARTEQLLQKLKEVDAELKELKSQKMKLKNSKKKWKKKERN